MTASWYQVTCTVPAAYGEVVADFLAERTGCGVCTENRAVDSFSTDDIPELQQAVITGYFSLPCNLDEQLAVLTSFVNSVLDRPLQEPLQVSRLGEEDWADSWKAHFRPFAIGRRLLITPSWEQPDNPDNRALIVLDPGMAFGTGGHETTRLCLECLEPLLGDPQADTAALPLLDLGTGSGILAIAAAKLGAERIDAVDIDPQAVQVAAENCRLNNVSRQVRCSTTPLEQLSGPYRVILANILAEELVRLAPALVQRLAPGGSLILSGILAEKEELVLQGYRNHQVSSVAATAAGEWRCLLYRREP